MDTATRAAVVDLVVDNHTVEAAAAFIDLAIERFTSHRGFNTPRPWARVVGRPFQDYLAELDIQHTKTPPRSPNHNAVCEGFHGTVLHEFYRPTFHRQFITRVDRLDAELQSWVHRYNTHRRRSPAAARSGAPPAAHRPHGACPPVGDPGVRTPPRAGPAPRRPSSGPAGPGLPQPAGGPCPARGGLRPAARTRTPGRRGGHASPVGTLAQPYAARAPSPSISYRTLTPPCAHVDTTQLAIGSQKRPGTHSKNGKQPATATTYGTTMRKTRLVDRRYPAMSDSTRRNSCTSVE
ncbi:MAG: integrase core domain-containing protein [Actinobacteria bacterium]|nr:integrase core domain-containing protein [Actinomycetota bacterium]